MIASNSRRGSRLSTPKSPAAPADLAQRFLELRRLRKRVHELEHRLRLIASAVIRRRSQVKSESELEPHLDLLEISSSTDHDAVTTRARSACHRLHQSVSWHICADPRTAGTNGASLKESTRPCAQSGRLFRTGSKRHKVRMSDPERNFRAQSTGPTTRSPWLCPWLALADLSAFNNMGDQSDWRCGHARSAARSPRGSRVRDLTSVKTTV